MVALPHLYGGIKGSLNPLRSCPSTYGINERHLTGRSGPDKQDPYAEIPGSAVGLTVRQGSTPAFIMLMQNMLTSRTTAKSA